MKAIKPCVHSQSIAEVIVELREFAQYGLSAASECRNRTIFALPEILKPDNVKAPRYSVDRAQEVTEELKLELLDEDAQAVPLIGLIPRSARTSHGYGSCIYVTDIDPTVQISRAAQP